MLQYTGTLVVVIVQYSFFKTKYCELLFYFFYFSSPQFYFHASRLCLIDPKMRRVAFLTFLSMTLCTLCRYARQQY